MTHKLLIPVFFGLIAAALISVLCVLLLPSENAIKNNFDFSITEQGVIQWFGTENNDEKLTIFSNILKETNGQLVKDVPITCGQVQVSIEPLESLRSNDVECWVVENHRRMDVNCASGNSTKVRDCVSMKQASGVPVYWFGGSELVTQKWPLNEVSLERMTVFLSSDLPKRHGNVLESYYLSSSGAALYVYPTTPLYVSVFQNNQLCLEATYDADGIQLVGPMYLEPFEQNQLETLQLRYAVCVGNSALEVHKQMTNIENGLIERPRALPDLRMMQDPIWSTWARFKDSINQTIVENFATEILAYDFPNSQLEIDDGYEENYGDFTFSPQKFPDPVNMVEKLHNLGFRVTTWVTPFINLNSKNYNTGKSLGYFVPKKDGTPEIITWWNGQGSSVDFTNKKAREWYKTLLGDIKARYSLDSFKFDAGETTYLPKSGLEYTAERLLNPGQYTTLYSKVAFDIGGSLAEMRSSWKTQDISFYMRLMDKGSTWDYTRGFKTVIPAALTFSIIGYPYVLPDMIGGNAYVVGRNQSKADRELYIRWIQLSAFLPCMQFSISPWQYDAEVTSLAKRYVTLHRTVVFDELVQAANRYIAGEMSLLVAPIWFLAEPHDLDAFKVDDQFLVGDRYLVAPIVDKGATSRDLYLPGRKGTQWKDKMRTECELNDLPGCTMPGGTWLRSYHVPLEEISWWEKV